LSEGVAAATFLACAGLNRLGMADVMACAIEPDEMLPAVAQGAIGIEIASQNERARALLAPLNHEATCLRVNAERAFLAELDGSCRTPLAGHATLNGSQLSLRVQALSLDGSKVFEAARHGPATDGPAMGLDAAREIRSVAGPDLMS
jgi:hydroxymethylbilane synthase